MQTKQSYKSGELFTLLCYRLGGIRKTAMNYTLSKKIFPKLIGTAQKSGAVKELLQF